MDVYHANLKSQSITGRGFADACAFGAADEGTAATIAGLIEDAVQGQLSSLTKGVFYHDINDAVEDGSRRTLTGILLDDPVHPASWKVSLRNAVTLLTDIDWKHMLKGEAGIVVEFAALGAAPYLPNSGQPVTDVKTSGAEKPGG